LYRATVEDVPTEYFTSKLGKADILRDGKDVKLVGWGTQVHVLLEVCADIFNPVTHRVKGYTRFVGKYVTGRRKRFDKVY